MKIGEIAKRAGVSTSRIRFYEDQGILPAAPRGANGYRDYPESLVATLGFIEQAQRLGFSLKEIAGHATLEGRACEALPQKLRAKLTEVDAHIAAAQARRAELLALIETLERGALEKAA
jgi:DNA-binding transcriptional MerR regulator